MQDGQIELHPFYHDLRNEIVKPRDIIVETKYFWDKWKPRLGPNLTVIIMELRRRCYYNSETGERRDYCWPSLKFLADACGISEKTIERELDRPEAKFFIRIEARGKQNGKGGRTSNKYYVAMDDPLLPEDKVKLEESIAKKSDAKVNSQIVDQPSSYSSNCRSTPEVNSQIVDQVQSEQSKMGLDSNCSQKGEEDVPGAHEDILTTTTDPALQADSGGGDKSDVVVDVVFSPTAQKGNGTDSVISDDIRDRYAKGLATIWTQIIADFRLSDGGSSIQKYFLSLLEKHSYDNILKQLGDMRKHFSSNGKEKIKNLRGWFKASLDNGWDLSPQSDPDDREEIKATQEKIAEIRSEQRKVEKEEREQTPEEMAMGRLCIHKFRLKLKGETMTPEEEEEFKAQFIQKFKEREKKSERR